MDKMIHLTHQVNANAKVKINGWDREDYEDREILLSTGSLESLLKSTSKQDEKV
jgi:hypothetical protein